MFSNQKLSLADVLGSEYIEAIAAANEALGELSADEVRRIGNGKVEFYPEAKQKKSDALLEKVGTRLFPEWNSGLKGAGTNSYMQAAHDNMAPVIGFTTFRIGEDGKLYLIGKSEHYHTPLGHRFNGYELIENAKKIGVTNATHNNTRGYIVRLMEKRVIQSANGIDWDDEEATAKVLSSTEPKVLNRIINLETGSLSCEAALKMMLARFFKLDPTFPAPKYAGKVPVFFVMGDVKGGLEGNYHGTTVLTQTLRGLWPEFLAHAEERELYRVVPLRPNDPEDLAEKMAKYNTGDYKTAGFLHEIVMMNYGGVRLTEDYLHCAYDLCKKTDTPVMCDEIQSCMWYKGMFLFRQYGLDPDFVIIGKGFPGGEYPASKCITTAEMDTLNQFGALVTNGQEELAALAYLVTMNFMRANGDEVDRLGKRFEDGLREIARRHADVIVGVEGHGHLSALHFRTVAAAAAFADKMVERCIDASAQIYKQNCVPAMLMKPPIISSEATIDYILSVFESIIA